MEVFYKVRVKGGTENRFGSGRKWTCQYCRRSNRREKRETGDGRWEDGGEGEQGVRGGGTKEKHRDCVVRTRTEA